MSDMERKSRADESRAFEHRHEMIMKNMQMAYSGELDVPLDEIPDNMEYRWIRDTVYNDPSQSRIGYCSRVGWSPVPASRHPLLAEQLVPWRASENNNYIFKRGLVLCERPKQYGEEEEKRNREHQINLLTSSPANASMLSDPSVPVHVYANQTSVGKSRSFRDE